MEPAVGTRAPLHLPAAGRPVLLAALARPRAGFASISAPSSSSGGGGGGGRLSAGGGGGGGGGDDSGAGAAAAAAAVAALGEDDSSDADADAIVLHVGGMTCGGCAAKVKRILENQPEVALATVDVEKAIAVVWTTPEAKATKDWQKQLGEKLANHLTTCGFQSHLPDEGEAEQADS
ncbi:copper-transporting ATPase PAA1, chloroplastic-like [Panicum miliaceum]|uniref:Copper-transporting ATPase PAA1, chloroplastic-like n=1 Tax=Panicum miliaceum TaxID=4540 RepID=A0A3L6TR55_PANMI|nr:copper-transporting ATPase PAA1, chloroplastic-like [Panicum miliaceum]